MAPMRRRQQTHRHSWGCIMGRRGGGGSKPAHAQLWTQPLTLEAHFGRTWAPLQLHAACTDDCPAPAAIASGASPPLPFEFSS